MTNLVGENSSRAAPKLTLDASGEIETVFRSSDALIVYRLGQGILNPQSGVQLPVGAPNQAARKLRRMPAKRRVKMNLSRWWVFPAVLAVSGVTGCLTPATSNQAGRAEPKANLPNASALSAAESPRSGRVVAPTKSGEELIKLPAYEVSESAFSDFGMSVRTNPEVKWGGNVEWMLVSGIDPGSSAAGASLRVGDRILAIDGRLVTELARDSMLSSLFQRKKGERGQLLVLGVRQSLPRFINVVAFRPGS